MVVLNTRRDAVETVRALLEAYPQLEGVYHLSTLLCPAHRRRVLAEIREHLRNAQPCRLIATQVVEAGVDLDFPLVMRAIGPLDRIVQAAGRCNREGRLPQGQVVIFELIDGNAPKGAYRTAMDEARTLLQSDSCDLHQPTTYSTYFGRLYQSVNTDQWQIQQKRKGFQFQTVAQDYRLIRDATQALVVLNYDSQAVRQLLGEAHARLNAGGLPPLHWYQQIQQYIVSVYHHELGEFERQGLVQPVPELGLLLYTGAYDARLGIHAQADPADLVV
jgi:CRISPR-associated endonuclease/helicase Cas3